ncbi:MAG: hypothetical protein IT429_14360 [Gemmataceae bacterium]|nr:hypothetical protein [Gemmataceae bacterium]
MAQPDAAEKVKEVKVVAERIRNALLRAHRTIYRAAVRRQHDIGTGNPRAADEAETSLGQRLYTDSYRDLVVLGFWYEGLKSPKYVCSTSGTNVVRAVRSVARRTLELANSWRAKDRSGVYHDFLREARRIEPEVQEVERETRRLVGRHELDMLRLRRTLGVAFQVSEAEARMASYLMRHDVAAAVHVYGTDSPCGYCSRTYAALGPAQEKVRQRHAAVKAGQPDAGRFEGPPGLRWRIGWVYYGELYHAGSPEKITDLRALDGAVRAGSIAGHALA